MLSDITIVILNYNGKSYLETFLPSVILNSEGARIVIADNSSTDDSIVFLEQNYPNLEIVINSQNGGFAKGYNEALNIIKSKYYLLLNSDIEVTKDWLIPLLKSIQNDKIAGCQPKILSYSNRNIFEHAGASGGFIDRNYFPFCRGRIFDLTELDTGQYDNEQTIFWASGAALLIKSEIFHLAGGFDDDFFAHMEEIDLCWRINKMGYEFKVVPNSVVYHVGGGTLAYNSPRKTYLNFRNSLYMITKNHKGLLFPKIVYRLLIDGVAGVVFLLKGTPNHTLSVLKAHKDFYINLSKFLGKRKQEKLNRPTLSVKNIGGFYNGSILWARYFKGILKYSELNFRLFKK
jgi:GT2 family glycosyltransferase